MGTSDINEILPADRAAQASARGFAIIAAQVREIAPDSPGKELARTLGINRTPGYVIGDAIIPGVIGAAGLERVQTAVRSGPDGTY